MKMAYVVSIPLWFLRNRFYYKDIIQVLGRQNQPIGKISQAPSNLHFGDSLGFDSRWTQCYVEGEGTGIF